MGSRHYAPRLVFASALLTLTCATVASAAPSVASATDRLTISGDRTSYTLVRLPKAVVLPTSATTIVASAPDRLDAVVLVADSAGDSAPGAAFVKLHGASVLHTAYQLFGTDNGSALTGTPVYATRRLPAGNYRAFLVTHGANRVTIQLPGLRHAFTTVAARTPTTSVVAETAPPGLPGSALVPESTTTTTFHALHRPLMLALGWARATSLSGQAYACAVQDPAANDPTADTPYCPAAGIVDFVDPEVDQLSYFDAWYEPTAGTWQFKNVWALQGVVTDGGGWVLQLDLGAGYPSHP